MISFVLFPYALVSRLYFDMLKLFLALYRAPNNFLLLERRYVRQKMLLDSVKDALWVSYENSAG